MPPLNLYSLGDQLKKDLGKILDFSRAEAQAFLNESIRLVGQLNTMMVAEGNPPDYVAKHAWARIRQLSALHLVTVEYRYRKMIMETVYNAATAALGILLTVADVRTLETNERALAADIPPSVPASPGLASNLATTSARAGTRPFTGPGWSVRRGNG